MQQKCCGDQHESSKFCDAQWSDVKKTGTDCFYSENIFGDKWFKRKWATKQNYIKYMNNIIKLKCCNYVFIYVNVLTNQDFKELLFKETVTNDLQCKFKLKLNLRE